MNVSDYWIVYVKMSLETLKLRLGYDAKERYVPGGDPGLDLDYIRLNAMGGTDQWTRLREDKLRGLRKAIFSSYQAAVIKFDNDDRGYEFRCLINHDKLKAEYEDKIISIPFFECPVNGDEVVDVGTPLEENPSKYRVKSGDTFLWISGNEGYMPDTHWIIYLQYSEETAYFRGEIRLCEDVVEINGHKYYAWTEGPDETDIVWNVKKNIVWNDLNYTKQLFITKSDEVVSYLERFDRIKLATGRFEKDKEGNFILDENGERVPEYDWWEVRAVNNNYGNGIIRIAIGETYNNTPGEEGKVEKDQEQAEREAAAAQSIIKGDITLYPYQIKTFKVDIPIAGAVWTLSNNQVAKIIDQDSSFVTLEIITGKSYKEGFDIIYNGENSLHVVIKSL